MRPRHLLAPLLLASLATAQNTQRFGETQPSRVGLWEEPFMHEHPLVPRWNGIHMSVIPKGPNRGKVLTWDAFSFAPTPGIWEQRYGIVDTTGPEPTTSSSVLQLPSIEGDLFCAGHAWMPNGNLFIAGGTLAYPGTPIPTDEAVTTVDPGTQGDGVQTARLHPGVYRGGRLAFIFDPADFTGDGLGTWHRQPNMPGGRWYPSVTRIPDGRFIVTGGIISADRFPRNDYEVFVPGEDGISGEWERNGPTQLFPGPSNDLSPLMIYPRLYHLTSGELFMAGMCSTSVYLDHANAPGVWPVGSRSSFWFRNYNTALMLPLIADDDEVFQDIVLSIGGDAYAPRRTVRYPGGLTERSRGVAAAVDICFPSHADPERRRWQRLPSLKRPRMQANAVLLPDRSIFVVGGRMNPLNEPGDEDTKVPELFDGERWRDVVPHVSPRTYHSAALLLPDGRVLTGGGDTSSWDYEIYQPPYLHSPWPRPQIENVPARMRLDPSGESTYEIDFRPMPAGSQVKRVVLVSPGSITHHWDFHQRSIEMIVRDQDSDSITVKAPDDDNVFLPGYYMVFLVSTRDVPSVAGWTRVVPPKTTEIRAARPAFPR